MCVYIICIYREAQNCIRTLTKKYLLIIYWYIFGSTLKMSVDDLCITLIEVIYGRFQTRTQSISINYLSRYFVR
jgi:hypothetical protein